MEMEQLRVIVQEVIENKQTAERQKELLELSQRIDEKRSHEKYLSKESQ